MAKKPIKPLIRALAEHIADDLMASHDAKHPRRKRLSRDFYKDELSQEDPLVKEGSKNERNNKRKSE